MARYRVSCTQKYEKHEYVLSLGCHGPGNAFTTFSEAVAIQRIQSGLDTFYVERPTGHVVEVIVAEREGKKYLKTTADGEKPNNLLNLPDCPGKEHRVIAPITVRSVVPSASHGVGGCF